MELDEIRAYWLQHEKKLVEHTRINTELLRRVLLINTDKRMNWLKIRTLVNLILPLLALLLALFIVIPRVEHTFNAEVIIGIAIFGSFSVITYTWAIRFYLLVDKLNLSESLTSVRKQLKMAEKYKTKMTKYGLMFAPFAVVGIFLSAGIPFLSAKMIPFYALMVIVFLISTYVRRKHGVVVQIKNINKDIEEISALEVDEDHYK